MFPRKWAFAPEKSWTSHWRREEVFYFDLTNTSGSRHRSGLTRFSRRLWEEVEVGFPGRCQPVVWSFGAKVFVTKASGEPVTPARGDWLVTAEIFAEGDRPGFQSWSEKTLCHRAAVFHDAIPLRSPLITWPRSVARHPLYMKELSRWDRVFSVSEESGADLRRYWQWLGIASPPAVSLLLPGADFSGGPRRLPRPEGLQSRDLLAVGILEPRKNQETLLAACLLLWERGRDFRLHLVGRVNPYFGKPVLRTVRRMIRQRYPLVYHGQADDDRLAGYYASSRFSIFPTRAEGFGLPVLESLWMGVPCLASDIAAVQEAGRGGGCVFADCRTPEPLAAALESLLRDDILEGEREALRNRSLPLWRATAKQLVETLDGS